MLGTGIIYHTAEEYRTVTHKTPIGEAPVEMHGSIHHPEHTDFAGLVTATREVPTDPPVNGKTETLFDLLIFPPGRAPVHLAGVRYGVEPGEFEEA